MKPPINFASHIDVRYKPKTTVRPTSVVSATHIPKQNMGGIVSLMVVAPTRMFSLVLKSGGPEKIRFHSTSRLQTVLLIIIGTMPAIIRPSDSYGPRSACLSSVSRWITNFPSISLLSLAGWSSALPYTFKSKNILIKMIPARVIVIHNRIDTS